RDAVHLERLRYGGCDLVLGRVGRDRERVAAVVRLTHRALGDDRTEEHEGAFHADTFVSIAVRATSASSAGRMTSIVSATSTSLRRSEFGVRSSMSGRLAIARAAFWSISFHTKTVWPVSPSLPGHRASSRMRARSRSTS